MKKPHFTPKILIFFFTTFFLGLFFMVQARSFERVSALTTRDAVSNIFREIQILLTTNKDLAHETNSLEKLLNETKDRSTSLQALEKEIAQNHLADGSIPVTGPGVIISMPAQTELPWVIDLINELFTVGAEGVSVNGIRLTNRTMGFDALPQGKILFNGNILQPSYVFHAIGDPEILFQSLAQPGGFLKRFEQFHKNAKVIIQKSDKMVLEKIL